MLKLKSQYVKNLDNLKSAKIKISVISLGCEKNLVDSELILGLLQKNKYEIEGDINNSDGVIINTCGFIDSAKEEALDNIFNCIDLKAQKQKENKQFKVIVCGCLAQRYLDELRCDELLKDVDLFIPIKDYFKFGKFINDLFNIKNDLNDEELKYEKIDFENRIITTSDKRLAYVKISDGCNNRCTYCAIPLIRGDFVSRNHSDIVKEVKWLVSEGYYEICLISQDLTNYGYDINDSLSNLIRDIDLIDGDYVIRLLYLYPDEINEELIDVIKASKHILHYFDIPLQHASNKILKLMHRRGKKEEIKKIINLIRSKINDACIRTTMIVGFPHESEKDFSELIEFIKEYKFNHLGAFMYSKEENTISYDYTMQVSKKKKIERYNQLMDEQKWISLKKNEEFIGKVLRCIIEDYDDEQDLYTARSYLQAPDDIDGALFIQSDELLKIGGVYDCIINEVDFYDMKGKVIK